VTNAGAHRTWRGPSPRNNCLTLATLVPTLQYRWNIFKNIRQAIDQNEGGIDKFAQGMLHPCRPHIAHLCVVLSCLGASGTHTDRVCHSKWSTCIVL
jgi:hypothetical protein